MSKDRALTCESKIYFCDEHSFEDIPIDWDNFEKLCTYKDYRFLYAYVWPVASQEVKKQLSEKLHSYDLIGIGLKECKKYMSKERYDFIAGKIPEYEKDWPKWKIGDSLLCSVHKHIDEIEELKDLNVLESVLFNKCRVSEELI